MSDDNMHLWKQCEVPPESAVRKIKGGRLSGKTDIAPQWRYQKMTEMFGPYGLGWYTEVVENQTHEAPNDEVLVEVKVHVYYRTDDGWSMPLEGHGGDKRVVKESKGLYVDDEALKKAVTDAFGKAVQPLGMGSEVYMGNYEGSKYLGSKQPTPSTTSEPTNSPEPTEPEERQQVPQNKVRAYFAAMADLGAEGDQAKDWAKESYELESFKDITLEQLRGAYELYKEMLERERAEEEDSHD